MSDPSKSDLLAVIKKKAAFLKEQNKKELESPNDREQELLDAISKLDRPVTKFQEDWFHCVFEDIRRTFRSAALDEAKDTLGVGKADTDLDKFQISTIRLIDTLNGYFKGNHHVTTIDNARATCEIISGLIKHLKKNAVLPDDTPLIYKSDKDIKAEENPDQYTQISAEMHKTSKARSNSAKHADRDANHTIPYTDSTNLQHILFSMVQDYTTLHLGLLKAGLLSTETECLYPIERGWLVYDGGQYKETYHPEYTQTTPQEGEDINQDILDIFKSVVDSQNYNDTRKVFVPAATVAIVLFRKEGMRIEYSAESRDTCIDTINALKIWPVSASTNARIVRDPDILVLNDEPSP